MESAPVVNCCWPITIYIFFLYYWNKTHDTFNTLPEAKRLQYWKLKQLITFDINSSYVTMFKIFQ